MICRSCGGAYYRKNKQKICLKCYTHDARREQQFYTVKKWKKFTWDIQAKLSEQYELILTDHKTLKEKVLSILKRQSPEKRMARKNKLKNGFNKFNKGVDMVVSGIDKFSKATNQMHVNPSAGDRRMDKLTGGLEKASGQDRDFSVLGGGGQTERKFKKKKYHRYKWARVSAKRKSKDSDPYSALSGGNDRDFSI